MTTGKQTKAPIIRFFRAIVHDGQQEAFKSFLLGTALPLLRSHDGMLSVAIGLPHEGSPSEFSVTTVWRDLQALKSFSGQLVCGHLTATTPMGRGSTRRSTSKVRAARTKAEKGSLKNTRYALQESESCCHDTH